MPALYYIEHPEQLDSILPPLADAAWIALDCEFMREDTYYPRLCLVQLATQDLCLCIDVLALDDLSTLQTMLTQTSSTKIFHAASQDLETLLLQFSVLPSPIFDTQIAASLLGLGEQVSYAALVEQICNIKLSKSQTRTNWAKRPLSDLQIDYALEDVKYLGCLYAALSSRLEQVHRLDWLQQECAGLLTHDRYQPEIEQQWKRVRGSGALQGRALFRLAQLCTWREKTAMQLNRPKQWVLSNNQLLELSMLGTTFNIETWSLHRSLSQHHERLQNELMEQLRTADLSDYPEEFNRPVTERLSTAQSRLVKKLMDVVKKTAHQLNISVPMLASRRSLEQLVRGHDSDLLYGWRRQVIGQPLLRIVREEQACLQPESQ